MILASACSCLCPIHWSQVLSREWRCSWSSADRRCSNYLWVIHNLNAYWGATYIRDLTVHVFVTVSRTVLFQTEPTMMVTRKIEAWTKWPTFCRENFHLSNENVCIFIKISLSLFLIILMVQLTIFQLWFSNAEQVISHTSNNVDQQLRYHVASMGHNGLMR